MKFSYDSVTEYAVVEAYSIKEIEQKVNYLISKGYVPIGGVTCPVRGVFIQTLIVYGD